MNPIQRDLHTTWHRLLCARLKAHWRYKVVAGSILAIGFNIAYFLFLYFPVFPVTEMPITALDRLIGFWPVALLMYMTLWIYISLSAWLLTDKRELAAYIKALSGLGMVGLTVFFFWPTSVPRPDIDVVEYPSFALLVAIDEPRNVFPCLHAAFAVFSAICIARLLRQWGARGLIRGLNWCWCVSIVYSALATKQHLAVDLFAGAALGAAWAWLYLRLLTRLHNSGGVGLADQGFTELSAPVPVNAGTPFNRADEKHSSHPMRPLHGNQSTDTSVERASQEAPGCTGVHS